MDSPASSSAQPTVPKSHPSKQQKKALIFFMISFLSVFYSYFYQILDEHNWVMERQAVRTDKASGIVNDANDWAIETMGNPRYSLELFQRVVTVSLETQKIVGALPDLEV